MGRSRSPSPDRSRSRSRSRSASSRSRTYSDSYTDYSDDYYSDQDSTKNSKPTGSKKPVYAKRKPTKAVSKKGVHGSNSKMSGARESQDSQVAHRMLSARRLKVNEMRNRVEELSQQLYEVERENKLLKRQNVIKDRVIDKHEGEEGEVPRLIQRHTAEVRALKEQLRKQKDQSRRWEQTVKEKDAQTAQLKKSLQKYKKMVESKNLGERDQLANRLSSTEAQLDESNKRVRELERHIDNLQKNHRHELGIERARLKETKAQLKDLSDKNDLVSMQLKEKEKELDVRNIYSMRVMKPPHKLGSALTSTASTPLPSNRRSAGHERKNSDPSPSRRKNQRNALNGINNKLEDVARQREKEDTPREEPKPTPRKGPSPREKLREEEERKRAEEERQRTIEAEKHREAERERREQEERERIRKEQEEEERRKEDAERLKREDEERERMEIERKAQEERDRIAEDAEEQERQRKKKALLAKLSAMDDSDPNGKTKNALTMSPPRNRKEWKFTEPVENMYQGKPAYDVTSSPKRKSRVVTDDGDDDFSYKPSFGGKWNNAPKTSAKGRSLFDDDDYIPSAKNNNNNASKRPDLMANLFGGDKARKPTPPSMEREGSGLDFTTNSTAAGRKSLARGAYQPPRRESPPQYGAGLGMVSDSPPPTTNNRMLPRRTHQASAGFNRATNDIDDLDDIEEFRL